MSPQWQELTYDFITGVAGTTLDLQIVDFPVVTGETFVVDNVSIRDITGIPVGVGDPETIYQARSWVTPMPIAGQGHLRFISPRTGAVTVEIFDAAGRRLATPFDRRVLEAGAHDVPLNGTSPKLRAGLYLYRIRLEGALLQGRFVVAR